MNNYLPIIYIHAGGQQYIKDVLRIAEKYNKKVVLIGNNENRNYAKEWVDRTTLYNNRIALFKENFENYSPNSYDFEYMCIERYFLLQSYMEFMKIDKVILCDSDNLLFCDMSKIDFTKYDVALNLSNVDEYLNQANCSYWTKYALDDFVDYIEHVYMSSISRQKLKEYSLFLNKNCNGQGISDMSLLQDWKRERTFKVWEISQISSMNFIADYNINSSENLFDMNKRLKIKRVKFINKEPYLYVKGKPIRSISLHCQGSAKAHIYMFSHYKSSFFWAFLIKICRHLRIIPFYR